jgi:hypothetical protein
MPVGRKRAPLVLSAEDRIRLETIRRSRTEEKRRTVRAAILLDAANGMADKANAAARQVNRNTVVLCVRKYLGFGLEAALGELPRSGKPRQISDDRIHLYFREVNAAPVIFRWKYKMDEVGVTS